MSGDRLTPLNHRQVPLVDLIHFEKCFYFVDIIHAHSLLLLLGLALDDAVVAFLADLVVVLDINPNLVDS